MKFPLLSFIIFSLSQAHASSITGPAHAFHYFCEVVQGQPGIVAEKLIFPYRNHQVITVREIPSSQCQQSRFSQLKEKNYVNGILQIVFNSGEPTRVKEVNGAHQIFLSSDLQNLVEESNQDATGEAQANPDSLDEQLAGN